MSKKHYRALLILAFAFALMPLHFILASGIQVSPTRLEFRSALRQTQTRQIMAANPSGEVQTFQVYALDFPSAITAEPNDFSLEPGGRKEIIVTLDTGKLQKNASTELAIVAKPLAKEKSLGVATGVKVPVQVTITSQANTLPKHLPIAAAVAAALLLLTVYLFTLKKKSPPTGQI